MKTSFSSMSGSEKAAVLLISLPKNCSARLLKSLRDEEIERVTLDITYLSGVDAEIRQQVTEEFYQLCMAQNYISEGGVGYAKDILESAFGSEQAVELINKITSSLQVRPFDYLRKTDPQQILNFIQNENNQTIALILSYLKPQQAAVVLSSLPEEKQTVVIEKIRCIP